MYYKEFKPCKELEKYIKCFWIMERIYDDKYGHYEYLWPTGLTEILNIQGKSFIYVREQEEIELSNEILIGAHNKSLLLPQSLKQLFVLIKQYKKYCILQLIQKQ